MVEAVCVRLVVHRGFALEDLSYRFPEFLTREGFPRVDSGDSWLSMVEVNHAVLVDPD
jgi:hypothetical protein